MIRSSEIRLNTKGVLLKRSRNFLVVPDKGINGDLELGLKGNHAGLTCQLFAMGSGKAVRGLTSDLWFSICYYMKLIYVKNKF